MQPNNKRIKTSRKFSVLSGRYGVFVEEVSLAGMPKPSLQGGIDGVFWSKYPITTTDYQLLNNCAHLNI